MGQGLLPDICCRRSILAIFFLAPHRMRVSSTLVTMLTLQHCSPSRCISLRLRQLENRRALIEGARFLMHRAAWGPQPRLVIVQYVEAVQTIRILAAQTEDKGVDAADILHSDWGKGASSGLVRHLVCAVPVSSVTGVELGSALFPPAAAATATSRVAMMEIGGGGGEGSKAVGEASGAGGLAARFSTLIKKGNRNKQPQIPAASSGANLIQLSGGGGGEGVMDHLPDLKCLSLLLGAPGVIVDQQPSKGGVAALLALSPAVRKARRSLAGGPTSSADVVGGSSVATPGDATPSGAVDRMVHLQLPLQGNGRSRDEWAHGFSDLIHASS